MMSEKKWGVRLILMCEVEIMIGATEMDGIPLFLNGLISISNSSSHPFYPSLFSYWNGVGVEYMY
jgi:hypothetical protein